MSIGKILGFQMRVKQYRVEDYGRVILVISWWKPKVIGAPGPAVLVNSNHV